PSRQILSLALLLRYSLDADEAATAIENAINRALEEGVRTGDLARGTAAVSTDEMGDIIARYVAEGV
ncbi:isocitrate/isopropylmalate family dehydrogenase, partial [Klebsiella pneumoniae]|uniref:isocitrate/isopropylmalate family dehydrogenase n=1 Tax=Klebsiella pneumoniae TaxID=573 RepID=UPI003F86FE21